MNHSLLAILNLVVMLLALCFLAGTIARAQWRRSGNAYAVFLIVVCGQVWLIPQAVSVFGLHSSQLLYSLWFANWLVSAVAVIIFTITFRGTSSHLLDAARMDGAGALTVFRHIVWPTAKPALGALALILIMATWMELFRPLLGSDENIFSWSVPMTAPEIAILVAVSLLGTLPVIALYFARRCFFEKAASA